MEDRRRQGDATLLDFEIVQEARKHDLLVPFEPLQLKGASYDLRVGDYAFVARPVEAGGYEKVPLKERGRVEIMPGQSVTFYSLERLEMPPDMKGRLSLRSHWAIKGLHFNGGIVDPGYRGILFFHMDNLADSTIGVEYRAGLVTMEFVRLTSSTQRIYNNGQIILDIPEEKLPPLPAREIYDRAQLQTHIEELLERVAQLEKMLEKRR